VDYIQKNWGEKVNERLFTSLAGLLNAAAWFTFCVPILQIAWILSKGGKRKLGMHALMGALVIGGSIAELLSRLMMVGIENVAEWMAREFNLDDWVNQGDGIGWKVLELTTQLSRGLILWVDSFEYLALFGVLLITFFSARTERVPSFGKKWANFGVFISILCLFDFLARVARFAEWRLFMEIAIIISLANTVVFIPVWLLILGHQLPTARPEYLDHDPLETSPQPAAEETAAEAALPVATID